MKSQVHIHRTFGCLGFPKFVRVLTFILLLALALGVSRASAHAAAVPLPNTTTPQLLQFRSGRHILGFEANKVYLAAFDHALSVEFVGTAGVTPQSSTGSARESITSALAPLTRVTYTDLWRGVNVTYDSVDGSIAKSTYLIAPGANVSQIQLRYNVPVELQSDGSLRFNSDRGYLTESAPLAWQEIAGERVPVSVMFSVSAENQVGFSVERYDPRYALVIDPVYTWHTFYGEGGHDEGLGVAVDGSGNVYLVGWSTVTWNGPSGQLPLHAHSSSGFTDDIVVVKLDSSGAYQWHTFYGGLSADSGMDIVAENSGNVYVLGQCNGTWNGPSGQTPLHSHTGGGGWDIVVLKLNSSGEYQWHTFYGSVGTESGRRIALDTSNNVYVLSNGDGCWTGPSGEPPLNPCINHDLAVLKLNSNGGYLWHTFYGSNTSDGGYGMSVDSNGSVFVVGYSDATWNGPSGQSPLHAHSGAGTDLLVLKLSNSGTYQWHTFYGSGEGYSIAVDGSGNSYIAGSSSVAWNGPSGQSPLHSYSGDRDMLVLKLNASGAYQWHTFYGSGSTDGADAITVDGSNNVYVAGYSYATWNGPSGQSPLHALSGTYDSAVLKLNSSGVYQWHTFYGSGCSGIAVDGSGNVHVTGISSATWNGPNGETPLHAVSGYRDIAVLKLNSGGTYQWHTFYGGASDESSSGIALDGSGNIYIAGQSNDLWSGPSGQSPLHYPGGNSDILVMKLNSSGTYQWHTYYGSSGEDSGSGIAVDGSGNVYVTGISLATWSGPNAEHPEQPLHVHVGGGNPNRYVLKLNSSGAYQWHTFYGIWDAQSVIGVDGSANVYIAGSSAGSWNGPLGQSPLHGYSGAGWDILVLKLNSSGAYQWHTFYGEIAGTDSLHSIAVDASGNVYAVGSSDASWNGPSGQLPLHAYNLRDFWVLKLNSNGQYQWHTFYGSSSGDDAAAITADGSNNVYVVGSSQASWNGPSGQSPLHTHSGGYDSVVLKLNSSGTYQWHTFYGAGANNIAVDGSGNVYVTGYSGATWNGPSGQSPLHAYAGGYDILVLKLNNSGAYQSHTFYGSTSDDSASGVAVDGSGNVYVTGYSSATWQGDSSVNPLHAYSGGYDLFVLKLAKSVATYLPMVSKSPPVGPTPVTDVTLYVDNTTGADITYEVLNTGCGQKTMAPGIMLYCTFPAGTYTWQATAQCGTASGLRLYPAGTQTHQFWCGSNRPAGTLFAR